MDNEQTRFRKCIERVGKQTEEKVKVLLDRIKTIESSKSGLESELKSLQSECPHDKTKHIPRQIAEDDTYDVCERCGATL